jgi:acyl-CoA reductase-like NAD-dependent aldehyde dehydrogenase
VLYASRIHAARGLEHRAVGNNRSGPGATNRRSGAWGKTIHNQAGDELMTSTQIDVKDYGYFAGNQWRNAKDDHFFEVHEPYSGNLFARVAAGSRADARLAVDAASRAFAGWSETAPGEKARLFLKAAEIVRRRRSEIAEVLARETGSTISFATFQQDLVAATLQQVAGWVFLPKGEVLETNLPGTHSIGVRRPLGVVASFTPWNGANVLSWRAVI